MLENIPDCYLGKGFDHTRLKQLRKGNYFTQKIFCIKTDVSGGTVARWEQGRANPTAYQVLKICDIFSVAHDELLSGESLSRFDEHITTYLGDVNDDDD